MDTEPLQTEYHYAGEVAETPNTLDLVEIDHSDGTPDVTYTYTQSGLIETFSDATGAREFHYNSALQVIDEDLPNGFLGANRDLIRLYQTGTPGTDVVGRPTGLKLAPIAGGTAEYEAAWYYDPTGRFERLTGPGLPAYGVEYGFVAKSDLVTTVAYKSAENTTVAETTRTYAAEANLLENIENHWFGTGGGGGTLVSNYAYINDDRHRRTSVLHTGEAFADEWVSLYEYNDRNELTASRRYTDTETDPAEVENPVLPQQFDYAYDAIGNRSGAVIGIDPTWEENPLAVLTYGANNLNQFTAAMSGYSPTIGQTIAYDADGNMSVVTRTGDMDCSGVVDNFGTDAFLWALFDPEEYAIEFPNCDIVRGDFDGSGVVDFFDIDPFVDMIFGGATSAGLLTPKYTWDAENRLIAVEPNYDPADGDERVSYAYDYLGRRVRRTVEEYDATLEDWEVTDDRKYLWHGWLQLGEFDALNLVGGRPKLLKTYVWGLDLTGSRDGAAGIGGLLAVYDTNGTVNGGSPTADDKQFAYLYDANGNVGQLVDWRPTAISPSGDDWDVARLVAAYEYDPYGAVILGSGTSAATNTWRFSTKQWDPATGLGYWGARYFNAQVGRWVSRDPFDSARGIIFIATLSIECLSS